MAKFIRLTRLAVRPAQPPIPAIVNIDHILLAYPRQGGGTTILYAQEHTVSFEDSVEDVEDRIANGPYIRDDHG